MSNVEWSIEVQFYTQLSHKAVAVLSKGITKGKGLNMVVRCDKESTI